MGLNNLMDLMERYGFQRVFKNKLIEDNGFVEGFNKPDYNITYAIDEDKLFTYLQTTQPDEYKKISNRTDFKSKFIKALREDIQSRGLLDVFRNRFDWNGAHFDMMIKRPHNTLNPKEVEKYNNNIVSVTEELVYNPEVGTGRGGRGDLTIFVNGLPLIWIELKSNAAGQNINNAKRQYCVDRDPSEQIFRYKQGCLVYFAMDLEEVWFATKLDKENTYFMPYNKGNGMHAGNPDVADDIKTSYMWREILTKDNILEWLENYLVNEKIKEKGFDGKEKTTDNMIFPRYHQFNEINNILADIKENGVHGQNYLIMDSPGSGKTYSIAWLAHHLASLHDANDNAIYDSVMVITDRVVVDDQLQKAILRVNHVDDTVETMGEDCTSADLAAAINNNKAKVIVSTIHKFSFILNSVAPMADKKFAIIIDECHSSTKGSLMTNVGKSLSQIAANATQDEEMDDEDIINNAISESIKTSKKHNNITLIGYSATPKKKTLELFGTKSTDEKGEVISRPFSTYSMQQAIEEGFILDVLKNYTTYKTYFKVNKKIVDDKKYKKNKTQHAILKYANLQPENIEGKVEIIIEHFLDKVAWQLNGTAKAMVIADSREGAVRYKQAFDKYIVEHNISDLRTLVAFTGKLTLKDDPSETLYSEASINGFPESKTKDMFNTSEHQILLVANKYQTGYNQPLLVAMYIDKQLKDTAAVQTLGRLNRTKSGKTEVFVLDFKNEYDDIKQAFSPYYTDLELVGETDPNKLYDVRRYLDKFKFISEEDLKTFIKISIKDKRSVSDVSKWNGILNKAKSVFDDISDADEQVKVKKSITKLVEGYSWVMQVADFEDEELHKKCIFYKPFSKFLRTGTGDIINVSNLVEFERFKQRKTKVVTDGGDINPTTQIKVGAYTTVKLPEEEELMKIEDLIREINERYNLGLNPKTHGPFVQQLVNMLAEDTQVKIAAQNKSNTEEDLQLFVAKKLDNLLAAGQTANTEFSDKILDNVDARKMVSTLLTAIIFDKYNKKGN